jgi:Fur family ferric uptake transcriptional regulator
MAPIDRYREFLAGKGLRVTREGARVVEEIFTLTERFEAERIVERMSHGQGRVSRSTIYRTLEKLEEAGLIRRVARDEGHEVYEHA